MELVTGFQFVGFFPKSDFNLENVLVHAEAMEKKYTELRELTCPEDND